jgi:beta-phosphoglucomutase
MANIPSERSIKAVIFDCDGTLVDSEDSHILAWQKTLESRGIGLDAERWFHFAGKPDFVIAEQIAEAIGSDSSHQLLSEKRGHFQKLHEQGLPPIEGTLDFLRRLADQKDRLGLKLGLASAAFKVEILSHLRHLEIEDFFDVILSGQEDLVDYADPDGVNKPKPYIYLHAAKLLGVSPLDCVVLEDSMTGVAAGQAAGCITVAIPNRFTAKQDFSASTLKLDSLAEMSVEEFLQLVKRC